MKRTFAAISLFFAASLQAAIATQSMNYQGQLTDLSDVAQNGSHQMAFQLFDAPTGGTLLWGQPLSAVQVTRGLFNVDLNLSALTRTPAVINNTMYLEVTVDGQILSPRKQVLTGVFALNADRVQGIEPGNGPNMIPVLDNAGRLNPSVVSAPFPLLVSGAAGVNTHAVSILNSDLGAGQVGLRSTGAFAALSGTAIQGVGAGVLGYTAGSDSAAATGVWGQAINGVGVRAGANSAGSTALQASNPAGLGIYGSGAYGAQLAASTLGLRIGGAGLAGQAASTPMTGIEVNSSSQGIVINNSGANAGLSAIANGIGVAVDGSAVSANGVGVRGNHSGGGFGTGVWGLSSSSGGIGVKAENTGAAGSGIALLAQASSVSGVAISALAPSKAIQAEATASTGVTFGIRALADSIDGQSVRGDASGSNAAYGVYGLAPASAAGAGVYGESSNHGVWGRSTGGVNTFGVYGIASLVAVRGESTQANGSSPRGVYGSTQSPDGTGVYGEALAGTGGNAFGVQGVAVAAGGTGVFGQGNFRGVAGIATGGNGRGVEGNAGPAGSGDGRSGLYGVANAAPNELVFGVYASVSGASASAYGIRAQANTPESKAGQFVNYSAQVAAPGYALDVEGKFKMGTDNAGSYFGGASPATQWYVACSYCGKGNLVILTPQIDISNGGTTVNSLWVAPADIDNGFFIARTAAPVANMGFSYIVVGK